MKGFDQFLRIAKIVGPHGLNGRLRLVVITDIIERFISGSKLYLKIDNEYREFLCIEFIEQPGRNSLIKLENVDDRNTALSLKGIEIFILKNEAEKTREYFDDDVFYYYDLIGCEVYYKNKLFGTVIDIMESGENSILILKSKENREFMIPFIDSMVNTVNIFKGRIDIDPVPGLLDEDSE